jgi:hypothetical protein
MATLPTRIQAQASAITTTTLIHIVVTGDTSQSPQGSSYKATLGQLTSLFGGNTDRYITGGTYSSGTLDLFDNSGNTISVSGFYTDQDDIYVTGGTYNSLTTSLDFSGKTGFVPFSVDGSALLDDTNTFVTGGTYSASTLTLNRNDGNSVIVTGFTDTNFANTNLTFDGNRSHDTNGFNYQLTSDGGVFGEGWQTLSQFESSIGWGNNFVVCDSAYIKFYTNSSGFPVERMSIQQNNGYVGIGTTSPSELLDVSGKTKTILLQITSGATNGYVLTSDSLGNATWQVPIDTNFANTDLTFSGNRTHNTNNNYLWIQTNGTTSGASIYMDSTNWIDVGFSNSPISGNFTRWTPTETIHYHNTVPRLTISNSETVINENGQQYNFRIEGEDDQNLFFVKASTGQDNIGIGTNSPSEKLEVSGKTKTINFQMTSGATLGYVLTASDNSGNATWTPTSGLTGFIEKYSTTLTTPSGTNTITHNLNTIDIQVSLWLVTTGDLTNARVTNRTANTVDIVFSSPPGENVRVVIIG